MISFVTETTSILLALQILTRNVFAAGSTAPGSLPFHREYPCLS